MRQTRSVCVVSRPRWLAAVSLTDLIQADKEDMADEELLDEDPIDEVDADADEDAEAEDLDDEVLADDDLEDDDIVTDDVAKDEEEVASVDPVRGKARTSDDDDEDDDEADPDDVEEDLDTILRDRIASGVDDDEDDDEDAPVEPSESGERVSPKAATEYACPECFLLVRQSQFSARRSDCPGGLDGNDCPMKAQFV